MTLANTIADISSLNDRDKETILDYLNSHLTQYHGIPKSKHKAQWEAMQKEIDD